jgi:Mor family transcriptional regulator
MSESKGSRIPPAHELLRKLVDKETYESILEELGGQTIYLPMIDRQSRSSRIRDVYHNLVAMGTPKALASRMISKNEHLTVRHVRRILARTSLR